MNVPNILTIIRFLIVPVFGYFLYAEQYLTATAFFVLSGITDVLDGYIARKFDMVTSWGKLADPVADKLMQITALIFLAVHIPKLIPVLIIFVAKETFMGLGTISLYRKENTIVAANWYGKMATVIFYFAIIAIIIIKIADINNAYTEVVENIMIGVAVVATLFAFFMYSILFRKLKADSK